MLINFVRLRKFVISLQYSHGKLIDPNTTTSEAVHFVIKVFIGAFGNFFLYLSKLGIVVFSLASSADSSRGWNGMVTFIYKTGWHIQQRGCCPEVSC